MPLPNKRRRVEMEREEIEACCCAWVVTSHRSNGRIGYRGGCRVEEALAAAASAWTVGMAMGSRSQFLGGEFLYG